VVFFFFSSFVFLFCFLFCSVQSVLHFPPATITPSHPTNTPKNAGHLAQGHRPATYRSISSIPKTHLLTCDYRGFGLSSLTQPPNIPTETGLITDAISLLTYIRTTLQHPPARTLLLGQSLGTAVSSAAALYFAAPTSPYLPSDLPAPQDTTSPFASIILVAPFRDLPTLLQTYAIAGVLPILKPLRGYPRIANYLATKIVDQWDTQARLIALISETSNAGSVLHVHILHARNDADITFRESEALYQPLQSALLGEEGVSATEERRSIHGGERVKRGAFAYKKVEDSKGKRVVELEVVRFGGHNEVVGWNQVGLAVRRGLLRGEGVRRGKVGLDVE